VFQIGGRMKLIVVAHTVIRIVMCEVTVTYAQALHGMQLVQPPSWFFPVLFHSHCFNVLSDKLADTLNMERA
jgi:hypothetical protein